MLRLSCGSSPIQEHHLWDALPIGCNKAEKEAQRHSTTKAQPRSKNNQRAASKSYEVLGRLGSVLSILG